jgi:hypothetical protein
LGADQAIRLRSDPNPSPFACRVAQEAGSAAHAFRSSILPPRALALHELGSVSADHCWDDRGLEALTITFPRDHLFRSPGSAASALLRPHPEPGQAWMSSRPCSGCPLRPDCRRRHRSDRCAGSGVRWQRRMNQSPKTIQISLTRGGPHAIRIAEISTRIRSGS